MTVFKLPDLGEGLQEAEISAWHVAPNDEVAVDQPLLAVETAKAIVEIPSPQAGTIKRLFGEPGDILQVGAPLVEFAGGAQDGDGDGGKTAAHDAGTVVGRVEKGNEIARERATPAGRAGAAAVKATPAVRALARRLDVDLAIVTPSGPNDTVTVRDVERVSRIFRELGPLEPLRGVRRTMARSMAQAHAEVAPVTVSDDADLAAWWPKSELMLRLIRAIAAGCKAEPALNAWFDSHALGRRLLPQVHLGIAVDTPDGLFVPVLRNIGERDPEDLRAGLERLRRDTRARTIPPEEMRGYTFTLSNFGTFGGRYANPIVQPPTVGILGAGRVRDAVVPANGVPAVHPLLPLSLTFDHRAVTGGEATRFLAAVLADLEKA
jgi:2-oxoisovalerate dehydrogenase E2 component (dihydrolipoyl transacylase)